MRSWRDDSNKSDVLTGEEAREMISEVREDVRLGRIPESMGQMVEFGIRQQTPMTEVI